MFILMFDFRKTNKEKSIIFGNANQNEKGKDRIPREIYTKKGKSVIVVDYSVKLS